MNAYKKYDMEKTVEELLNEFWRLNEIKHLSKDEIFVYYFVVNEYTLANLGLTFNLSLRYALIHLHYFRKKKLVAILEQLKSRGLIEYSLVGESFTFTLILPRKK